MKVSAAAVLVLSLAWCEMAAAADDRLAPRDLQRKAVMPFRVEVSPPQAGVDSEVIRVKPVAAMPLALSEKVCAISVRPAGGSTGVPWQGPPDPTCAREETVRLPIGRYTVRLAVMWRVEGATAGHNDAQDVSYEVRAGDRLRIRSLRRDATPPATNTAGKFTFEVENVGPVRVNGFLVRGWFHAAGAAQLVLEKRVGSLQPGEVWRDALAYFPVRAGPARVSVEADTENVAGEGTGFRENGKMEREFDVAPGPPPRPIVVTGAITTQKSAVASTWALEFTVCNVDPDAAYQPRLMCVNCPSHVTPSDWGWCSPSRAETYFCGSSAISRDGAGITPACPAGLAFRAVIKPEAKLKEVSPWADRDFQLLVQAKKAGHPIVSSDVVTIRVPTDCRLPPCVRAEGFREQPPFIR